MLQVELKKIQNPDVRACKDMFSDFITQQFQSELERSKCYRFKVNWHCHTLGSMAPATPPKKKNRYEKMQR